MRNAPQEHEKLEGGRETHMLLCSPDDISPRRTYGPSPRDQTILEPSPPGNERILMSTLSRRCTSSNIDPASNLKSRPRLLSFLLANVAEVRVLQVMIRLSIWEKLSGCPRSDQQKHIAHCSQAHSTHRCTSREEIGFAKASRCTYKSPRHAIPNRGR
jgi:hypothetical protein